MWEMMQIVLIGAIVSCAATSLFLFLMSPLLMGDAAPESARRLFDFLPWRRRIRYVIVNSHLVAASAAVFVISAPQPIVLGDHQPDVVFVDSSFAGGTALSETRVL